MKCPVCESVIRYDWLDEESVESGVSSVVHHVAQSDDTSKMKRTLCTMGTVVE